MKLIYIRRSILTDLETAKISPHSSRAILVDQNECLYLISYVYSALSVESPVQGYRKNNFLVGLQLPIRQNESKTLVSSDNKDNKLLRRSCVVSHVLGTVSSTVIRKKEIDGVDIDINAEVHLDRCI